MTLPATRRRPTGLLIALVGAAVVVGAGLSALGGDDSPAAQLRRRIEQARTSARFEYTYRRGGTRVLDCVLANTGYVGDVDRDVGALVVRLARGGDPVAAVTGDAVLLHRSLFAEPSFTTPWLRLPRRPTATEEERLRRALGNLAGDIFAADLPASGKSVALSALDVATDVDHVGAADIDGEAADRYRITVDPQRYAAIATTTPATGDVGDVGPVPAIEVWVTGDGVARVAIAPTRPNGTPGAREDGWIIDYQRAAGTIRVPAPAPADITELATAGPAALAAARRECRLPA